MKTIVEVVYEVDLTHMEVSCLSDNSAVSEVSHSLLWCLVAKWLWRWLRTMLLSRSVVTVFSCTSQKQMAMSKIAQRRLMSKSPGGNTQTKSKQFLFSHVFNVQH